MVESDKWRLWGFSPVSGNVPISTRPILSTLGKPLFGIVVLEQGFYLCSIIWKTWFPTSINRSFGFGWRHCSVLPLGSVCSRFIAIVWEKPQSPFLSPTMHVRLMAVKQSVFLQGWIVVPKRTHPASNPVAKNPILPTRVAPKGPPKFFNLKRSLKLVVPTSRNWIHPNLERSFQAF